MTATETMRVALLALEDAASVIGTSWADSVAHKPIAALRAALDATDDDVDVLASYSRTDGRREWVNVGVWLRPGEVVAHMADPRPNVRGEARLAAHQPSHTATATPQGIASTDQLGGRVRSEKD